jgi:type II secretory pathway component PulF
MDEKRSADRIKELVDGVIPVIPEFPVNLMLVFVGVVVSAILVSRVMPMGSKMKI